MTSLPRDQIERNNAGFTVEGMLHARKMTRAALEQIASQIQPGMSEAEALKISETVLREMGSTKKWHRTWIRFGANTLKHYGVPSDPTVTLGEDDIFFIDLGPVWDGHEGDAGKTFVTGNSTEMKRAVMDSEALFFSVKQHWAQNQLSGQALYHFAVESAEALGWKLNLEEANGHRLSDFPHALIHRGPIDELPFSPSRYLWVLEIQLRHPTLPFGAFFEDLLV